jgi:uncharacterized protein involved in exopolysaccharide biosynthesis
MAIQPQSLNPIRPVEDGQRPQEAIPTPSPIRPGIEQLREIGADAFEALWRRQRVFAVVAGAFASVLLLAILFQTPHFEATSLILVKFGRELVYQSEVGKEQTVTSRGKETMINSELAILHSRPVLEKVAHGVGLDGLYPDLAEAVAELKAEDPKLGDDDPAVALLYSKAAERLGEAITAQALPDADVLSVGFQHPDPGTAQTTVRELVNQFIEAHLEAYGEPQIATFLGRRVSDYEKRLDESEKQLLEFETEHTAFALESPQTTLMQWRDETVKELSEVENQIAAIRARHHEDAAVTEARNTQMRLQLEANQLEGKLRQDTNQRIDVVQKFIANRRAEVEREVGVFERKKQELSAKLAQTKLELRELPTLSAEYRRLRRERDADEEQYNTYQRRLRDARLSAEMDREKITSISVIQPASTAPEPVWPPSKMATIPMALVLSLVFGGLAAVLAERLGGTGVAWLDEGAEAR